MNLEHLAMLESKKIRTYSKNDGEIQKDKRTSLKGLPNSKAETIWLPNKQIVIKYNLLNKNGKL